MVVNKSELSCNGCENLSVSFISTCVFVCECGRGRNVCRIEAIMVLV